VGGSATIVCTQPEMTFRLGGLKLDRRLSSLSTGPKHVVAFGVVLRMVSHVVGSPREFPGRFVASIISSASLSESRYRDSSPDNVLASGVQPICLDHPVRRHLFVAFIDSSLMGRSCLLARCEPKNHRGQGRCDQDQSDVFFIFPHIFSPATSDCLVSTYSL